MPIFKKNPNEVAYMGGKKHTVEVIKNTGPNESLIWRQPEEDFNNNSTLIVMPGEEAIFINGGTIEKVFDEGTYKLSTENYPFISRLRNIATGGISAFNCVVYFVRKADSREILWGTDTPIQVRDKVWGVRTEARVRGAYKVRIVNSAKFLKKLIGSKVPSQFQEDLNKYFRNEFQGKIKAAVSKFLNNLQQELIGIDAYMDDLSNSIEPYIDEALEDYGLKCVRFSLSGMDIDTTKYDRLDESQIELIERTRGFQGDKAGLDVLGEDWGRVQNVGILKDFVNNQDGNGVASAGAGLGMGVGAFGAFGAMTGQVFNQTVGGFEQQVTAKADKSEDPAEVLAKLKKMLDAGLIEKAEYDAKKTEILSKM